MTNTMPVLTDAQRDDLHDYITGERVFHKHEEDALDELRDAITLAALTAESVGHFAYHKDEDGDSTDFIIESDGFTNDSFKLYPAPPVPALKLPPPMRFDAHPVEEAVFHWNRCLTEVKKLNGVTE